MISVHMTTFRRLRSGLLSRAVESVLAQTYRNFEFIICDDASADGSSDYLASVSAGDSRVKIIRNPKNVNSVAISLARCFKQADPSRNFISWMFDDCTLEPHAFEVLMKRASDTDAEFVFGITRVHNKDGSTILVGDQSAASIRDKIDTSSIVVPNGALLLTRSVFDKVGWYDSNIILRRSCDWDLFRRIIHSGCLFEPIPKILMDEFGGLQNDSLRNSFTTTFEIMAKYAALRDRVGFDISVDAILNAPVDFIPPGQWSPDELMLIYAMFVEYYLSIGNVARAYVWAEKLNARMTDKPFFLENLVACVKSRDTAQSLMAAGALAAGIYWAFKETRVRHT